MGACPRPKRCPAHLNQRDERLRLEGITAIGENTVFPGIGTLVNVMTVLIGSVIGVLVGHRLAERTRDVVTDALGLVTMLVAALAIASVNDGAWSDAVGDSAPVLIVLGSLVVGGVIGSIVGIEDGLERFGGWLQSRLSGGDGVERTRFIEGYLTASLVFCVGPLTILGALNDGLGNGADQLYLKSALDGFAAIAFAASLGWGVAASVVSIVAIQGSLTVVGIFLNDVLPDAELAAVTTTGGLMLVGVGLRLLRIRQIPVGDLLPALLVAPLLTALVAAFR
jgi:uncharacterized membrane protein YqgA involved in biofilm formation